MPRLFVALIRMIRATVREHVPAAPYIVGFRRT